MCLYVEQKKYGTASKDIPCFKIAKLRNGTLYSYFEDKEFPLNVLLTNDSPIRVVKTTDPFPHKFCVRSGVFHTFNASEIDHIIPKLLPDVCIVSATIPKGTTYFNGFSHSFTYDIEQTYGSSKIIYNKVFQLKDWRELKKELSLL